MIPTIDDSNHSIESTFVAEDATKQPLHLLRTTTSARSSGRCVSFDEDSNEYFPNTIRCAEDCHETWYNKMDYKHFRAVKRECINQWQIEKSHNSQFFKSMWKAIRDLYLQAKNVDFLVADACELEASAAIEMLSRLLSRSNNEEEVLDLIGLEDQLVESVRANLLQRRDAIQDVVYDIQGEHRRGLWHNNDEMQAEIQESCLNFSQCSGLFFQLLALARQAST